MDFANSETKINLMKAFAGESQARNRYNMAAKQAKKEELIIVESLFNCVACQEQAHATVFYDHLKEVNDTHFDITGSYPVNNYSSTADHLKAAVHNEMEEYEDVYKHFAEIAKNEGFPVVASAFEQIAKIEKSHADKFNAILQKLESNSLFSQTEQTTWVCTNCGHIHYGSSAPKNCPVCHHVQGYFLGEGIKII